MPSPRVPDPRRGLGPYQVAILERMIATGVPAHRARRIALWGDPHPTPPPAPVRVADDIDDYTGPIWPILEG